MAITGLWFFGVRKLSGNDLSPPAGCMEEETEAQDDKTNCLSDCPAGAFPPQLLDGQKGKIMGQFPLFEREFLEVISLF